MILLVGAGAVGTVLAAHLAAAGRELQIYARDKDRPAFERLSEVRIDDAAGRPRLTVPRPALSATLDLAGVEYLLICTKFAALDALLDQLPAQIPPGCTLVSTLNGLNAIERLRARFPAARSLQLTVMYNAQLPAPLHARLTTRPQLIVGGEDRRLAALLRGSGLQVKLAPGETAAWGKLLINLANAIAALTHTTFRDLLSDIHLRRIFVGVLDEAIAVLDAAGIDFQLPMPLGPRAYRALLLHGGPLPWWLAQMRNGLREGAYPSMVADVEAGRVTEIDQLNGEILRLGSRHGIAVPYNRGLVQRVKQLQSQPAPVYLAPAELLRQLAEET